MSTAQLAFRALADPTRRDILAILAAGERSVADVATEFDMTRPAVKKHLAILEQGGLIETEARGRERINRIARDGFAPVIDWFSVLDAFWDDRLAALKLAIEKDMQ